MPYNDPIPDPKPQSKLAAGVSNLVQAEKLLQIALVLPSATLIGWGAGAWADGHFHQSWISIAGIIFGSVSGMVYVIRQAFDAERNSGSGNGSGKETSSPK